MEPTYFAAILLPFPGLLSGTFQIDTFLPFTASQIYEVRFTKFFLPPSYSFSSQTALIPQALFNGMLLRPSPSQPSSPGYASISWWPSKNRALRAECSLQMHCDQYKAEGPSPFSGQAPLLLLFSPGCEVGPIGSQTPLLIHIEFDVFPKHMLRVTCPLKEK